MRDRITKLVAGALFAVASWQAGTLAWGVLDPKDPGCALYGETAGRADRVALSGGEAVEALFDVLDTTRDPEVRDGIQELLDATAAGDATGAAAAQQQVMQACGLTGLVQGYGDFEGQLTQRLG